VPELHWTLDVVRSLVESVAARRPVFHSEADFQHAFAWQIQTAHPEARVRLESRPRPGVRLDVFAALGGTRIAFELKYLLRNLTTDWDEEHFALPAQSAQDVRRYDFIKDIVRLEALLPDIADVGYAIAVTNDPTYWTASSRANLTDAAFRLHEGRELTGELAWAVTTGAGTMAKREAALALRGSYVTAWQDFSSVEGVGYTDFRYVVVEVR
jgi:hypothetical protein